MAAPPRATGPCDHLDRPVHPARLAHGVGERGEVLAAVLGLGELALEPDDLPPAGGGEVVPLFRSADVGPGSETEARERTRLASKSSGGTRLSEHVT